MKYQFKTPKTNQWRFLLTSGTVNDYKKPVTSLIIQCGVWFVLELIFPQFIYSHTETVDLQPWGVILWNWFIMDLTTTAILAGMGLFYNQRSGCSSTEYSTYLHQHKGKKR